MRKRLAVSSTNIDNLDFDKIDTREEISGVPIPKTFIGADQLRNKLSKLSVVVAVPTAQLPSPNAIDKDREITELRRLHAEEVQALKEQLMIVKEANRALKKHNKQLKKDTHDTGTNSRNPGEVLPEMMSPRSQSKRAPQVDSHALMVLDSKVDTRKDFSIFKDENLFRDMVFRSKDGTTITAHRLVVGMWARGLSNQLHHAKDTPTIDVPVTTSALQVLMEWMYSSPHRRAGLLQSELLLPELFTAAKHLGIPELLDVCQNGILKKAAELGSDRSTPVPEILTEARKMLIQCQNHGMEDVRTVCQSSLMSVVEWIPGRSEMEWSQHIQDLDNTLILAKAFKLTHLANAIEQAMIAVGHDTQYIQDTIQLYHIAQTHSLGEMEGKCNGYLRNFDITTLDYEKINITPDEMAYFVEYSEVGSVANRFQTVLTWASLQSIANEDVQRVIEASDWGQSRVSATEIRTIKGAIVSQLKNKMKLGLKEFLLSWLLELSISRLQEVPKIFTLTNKGNKQFKVNQELLKTYKPQNIDKPHVVRRDSKTYRPDEIRAMLKQNTM